MRWPQPREDRADECIRERIGSTLEDWAEEPLPREAAMPRQCALLDVLALAPGLVALVMPYPQVAAVHAPGVAARPPIELPVLAKAAARQQDSGQAISKEVLAMDPRTRQKEACVSPWSAQ